ncbi:MAG: LytTR family DNA-binding domain-containing protein [Ferruginibacter sp.]
MTNNNNYNNTNAYRLVLATNDGTYYFSPEQIVRMESSSNYTNIYFTDRKPILASKVLKEFEEALLPFGFLRTHRSHLVNRRYITRIANDGNIVMEDLSKAELSRRRKSEVLKMLRKTFLINQN